MHFISVNVFALMVCYRSLPPAQSVSAEVVTAFVVVEPSGRTMSAGELCGSVTKGVVLGGIVIAGIYN